MKGHNVPKLLERKAGFALLIPVLGLILLSFTSCGNNLLNEARTQQAQSVSARLVLAASDGSSLSSGGSLSLGSEAVGGTASATLTIKNSGVNDLSIAASAIVITLNSGSPSGVFTVSNPQDITVKAGASASITIAFTPPAAQSYGATLTIASNDLVVPSFAVKLSGTGIATDKAFTSFGLQSPVEVGAIDQTAKTVSLNVPYGTSLTALVATFASTGTKVLVGSSVQTSGTTANDFSNPVTYTVVAQDGTTATYKVSVSVGNVVPILTTTSSLTSIGVSSATGSGTVTSTGGSALTSTGLCWSSSNTTPAITDTSSSHYLASSSPSTSFSLTMSSLNVGTTYYLRAYATNSVGTGYGSVVTFITLPGTPVVSAVTTIGGTAGSGELSLSWSAAAGATAYNVYANTTNAISATPATGGSGLASSTLSATISGLSNYNTYYVWVVASNASGSVTSASMTGYVGVKATAISLNKSSVTLLKGSSETLTVSYTTASGLQPTEPAITWSTSSGTYVTVSSGTMTASTSLTGSATITASCGAYSVTASCAASVIAYSFGSAGPAGGLLFYDKGSYSNGWRYMEAYWNGGAGTFYSTSIYWCPTAYQYTLLGTTSTAIGTGKENSDAIIAAYGSSGTKAGSCESFVYGGYSDWFMPSILELKQLYTLGTPSNAAWESSSENGYNGFYGGDEWNSLVSYAWEWSTYYKSTADFGTVPVRRF